MVPKTIRHLIYCKANGTLIVPKWPSSAFWPVLFDKDCIKREYISDIIEFDEGQNIYMYSGSSAKCVFDSRRFKSKVLAVRITGSSSF